MILIFVAILFVKRTYSNSVVCGLLTNVNVAHLFFTKQISTYLVLYKNFDIMSLMLL